MSDLEYVNVKVTKLNELPDAKHPGNIEEGFTTTGRMPKSRFVTPEVDSRFNVGSMSRGWWSTSAVQEIIDESTFRTYNSIYKWELVKDQS